MRPSKESLFLRYKAFFSPFSHMLHPDGFLFYALPISPNWNVSTERLVELSPAASRSPLSHFFKAYLILPLLVTLIHFTLLSYERTLRLPTSFPISGLARLGVKPKLCRSSWRAFASTYPLTPLSTSPKETLFAFPSWTPPFLHRGVHPLHALALISLYLAKVRLSLTLTLSPLAI